MVVLLLVVQKQVVQLVMHILYFMTYPVHLLVQHHKEEIKMMREIFEVYAKVIDANGSYNTLSGYPKTFDSRNYNDDIEKALRRARGEWHEVLGTMYKRDDRQV